MGTQNHFDNIRSWIDIAEWCSSCTIENWTLQDEFQIRASGFRTIAKSTEFNGSLYVNINVSVQAYPTSREKYTSLKFSAREPMLKNDPVFSWIMARLMPNGVMDWRMEGTDIFHEVRAKSRSPFDIVNGIEIGLKAMEQMRILKNEAEEKLFQSFGS